MAGVHIHGLRELVRDMEKAGVDVAELKEPMAKVAAEAADVMQGFIPLGRTGRLRASARGNRAKAKAVVTVGTARVAYAKPIQWGSPRRNIKPAAYVEKTDAVMDTRAVDILTEGWEEIARRNNLL